jgi:hypothetical protein
VAKTELNSALKGISGGIDNWVYRQRKGQTVICRRPIVTSDPTESQLAVRERFRQGASYARMVLADPVRRAVYEPIAKAKGLSLFTVTLTDFLKPPTVDAIDLTGYHGMVGDVIRVQTSDYAGVTAVSIAIRAPDLTVREEGAAVLEFGAWVYTATTLRIAGETVTISATAVDRPGHTGTKTESWT